MPDGGGVESALRPAGTELAQDWGAVRDHLAGAGHTLGGEQARQFRGGVANLNYLVTVDGGPAVLRVPPFAGAGDPRREARVHAALAGAFPLVPRVVHLCADERVLGAPFLITEFRAGIVVGGTLPPGLSGAALTRSLTGTMAALHRLDPEAIGLGDFGRPEGFLTRQVQGWSRRAAAVWPDGVPAAGRAVLDWLDRTPPAPQRISLLHGDLKFDNMLVDPGTGEPLAVIDWELAARGDPLFDLAVLLSYWISPGDPAQLHGLDMVPGLTPGFPSRRDAVHAYVTAAGIAVPDLSFHLTLARLRLAVAWMQLYRGFERGALVDPAYKDFEGTAEAVLTWTAETLHDPPL